MKPFLYTSPRPKWERTSEETTLYTGPRPKRKRTPEETIVRKTTPFPAGYRICLFPQQKVEADEAEQLCGLGNIRGGGIGRMREGGSVVLVRAWVPAGQLHAL